MQSLAQEFMMKGRKAKGQPKQAMISGKHLGKNRGLHASAGSNMESEIRKVKTMAKPD